MKTPFLRLITAAAIAWLLLPMGSAFSQTVQVKTLSADYTNKKVTFSISWAAGTRDAKHLSKVWMFIDYAAVVTNNTLDTWQRAAISSATTTAGTISGLTGQGFFLKGTAGTFSAEITATIDAVPSQFSWCAHATDYPPTAILNNGTYTLSGTPPFVINDNSIHSSFIYSGGLITSLTDETGCPGIVIAEPVVTTTSPAAVCAGKTVNLTATTSGGTTTVMTYNWNIGGAQTTTTSNTFTVPAASITTSKTFTVSVTNAYNTTSKPANGSITVTSPATNGQTPNACGCATGTINCSGTCKTNSTYTTNDGACASCGIAYIQQRNPCGTVKYSVYDIYNNSSCTNGCTPSYWTTCSGFSYISSVDSDAYTTWSKANTICKNRGMRLPTLTELQCICANKASLPGGYVNSSYWTDGTNLNSVHFHANCSSTNSSLGVRQFIKCVK